MENTKVEYIRDVNPSLLEDTLPPLLSDLWASFLNYFPEIKEERVVITNTPTTARNKVSLIITASRNSNPRISVVRICLYLKDIMEEL